MPWSWWFMPKSSTSKLYDFCSMAWCGYMLCVGIWIIINGIQKRRLAVFLLIFSQIKEDSLRWLSFCFFHFQVPSSVKFSLVCFEVWIAEYLRIEWYSLPFQYWQISDINSLIHFAKVKAMFSFSICPERF